MNPILNVSDLHVALRSNKKNKLLVNDVHFSIPELSTTALVGGSGSGKTTIGLSILRLLDPALNIQSGKIVFEEKDLLQSSEEHMRRLRGGSISMVFQEPLNAFNPVFTLGYQIDEVLQIHTKLDKFKRQKRVLELCDLVGLPEPQRSAKSYPHQLSGGQRQRAMIAQAIAANPKLIIADEPTSNLDVTLQARVMELFQNLKKELNLSILLITHDLGLVKHFADEVVVMNEGKAVEIGKTQDILNNPQDSYTKKLMQFMGGE